MTVFARALLVLAPLSVLVSGAPLPQSGGSTSCDSSCLDLAQAALSCQNEPASRALSCLCSANDFVTAGQACISCGGGNVFPGGTGLDSVGLAIEACGGTTTSLAQSSSAVVTSSASGSTAAGAGVRVTEASTVPITVSAWAPEGFSPSLTYLIEETGGVNTTLENVRTSTVTRATVTFTATVTNEFVLGPSAIVQYQGNDGFDDITYCTFDGNSTDAATTTSGAGAGNGTIAECVQYEFDGSSLTLQETFTLTGATSAWVAYPQPTGTAVTEDVLGSRLADIETAAPAAPSGTIGQIVTLSGGGRVSRVEATPTFTFSSG